jgi:hypothetical protein
VDADGYELAGPSLAHHSRSLYLKQLGDAGQILFDQYFVHPYTTANQRLSS